MKVDLVKVDLVKESFKKALSYLDVWKKVEGVILLCLSAGIILPLGGRADLVIAICVAFWGLKKLFWG